MHQPGSDGRGRCQKWLEPRVAAKTGTTQEHKSAAFLGIVPSVRGRDHIRQLELASAVV